MELQSENDSAYKISKKEGRIEYLDIAKGIGIILVVWAHASGPGGNYINQFHIPLFSLYRCKADRQRVEEE